MSIFNLFSIEAIFGQIEELSFVFVESFFVEFGEMLVDIKINVCNFLRENENMKNNMDELKAIIRGQNVKIVSFRVMFNKLMK